MCIKDKGQVDKFVCLMSVPDTKAVHLEDKMYIVGLKPADTFVQTMRWDYARL
jgi:hypothetical protein